MRFAKKYNPRLVQRPEWRYYIDVVPLSLTNMTGARGRSSAGQSLV